MKRTMQTAVEITRWTVLRAIRNATGMTVIIEFDAISALNLQRTAIAVENQENGDVWTGYLQFRADGTGTIEIETVDTEIKEKRLPAVVMSKKELRIMF